MRKIILFIMVLGMILAGTTLVQAQTPTSTFTPTATPFPNCCLLASPWSSPTFGGGGDETINTSTHQLYLSDTVDNVIHVYQYDGTSSATLPTTGTLSSPEGVGLDASGNLYVAEFSSGNIKKIDSTGTATVFAHDSSSAQINVFVDGSGNLYCSTDSDGIFEFDSSGTQKASFGSGQISGGNGIWKTGETLYVVDGGHFQIVSYTESSLNSYTYGAPTTLVSNINPFGLWRDIAGYFYVADYSFGYKVYSVSGNLWTQVNSCDSGLNPAISAVVDETGAVYVGVTSPANTVVKIAPCAEIAENPPVSSYAGSNPPGSGQCFIYPSPARGDHATLSYNMAGPGKMEARIWNQNGELAARLTDSKPAGVQISSFSLSSFAPGIYYYAVTLTYDSGQTQTIKIQKFAVVH